MRNITGLIRFQLVKTGWSKVGFTCMNFNGNLSGLSCFSACRKGRRFDWKFCLKWCLKCARFLWFSIYARFSFIVIFNTVTIDIRVIQTYNHVCDYIHTEYKGIDNYRKKYTVYHRWMLVLYYFPTTYKPALKALF